ncbi:hypothetical protein GCM10027051_30710 [Niabella terrae]
MKSLKRYGMMSLFCLLLSIAPTQKSHALIWEVVQAALVKVIKAMDLAVQRLQNKTIWLQNAQKAIENSLSKLKLEEISEWAKKHKEQYEKYYKELVRVKASINHYRRVKSMIVKQVSLVEEYKRAFRLIKQDRHFSPKEIIYMGRVYAGILNESVRNLDQLLLTVQGEGLVMTDGKRLAQIEVFADKMDQLLADLRLFNRQNIKISLQRSRSLDQVNLVKRLYGLPQD